MATARQRQVKLATGERERQIEALMHEKLVAAVHDDVTSWRFFTTGRSQPVFCWTTTAVERLGDTGWASYVATTDRYGTVKVVDESITLHKQRKLAKARAWNLYQGWRLARGLKTTWRTFA